jgi:hypothetical protein
LTCIKSGVAQLVYARAEFSEDRHVHDRRPTVARRLPVVLHFDLLEEGPGEPPSLDSEAVVDLQAPGGSEAIAAVRRCAEPPQLQAAVPQPSNQLTQARR